MWKLSEMSFVLSPTTQSIVLSIVTSVFFCYFVLSLLHWSRRTKGSITSLPPADSATAAPRASKLTDSIYELYKPGVESSLDIVFFHGLQLSHTSDAHESTWRSRGSQKEVWPMTWLPEEFPKARILSVNYDAYITTSKKGGRLDLYNTAESLMANLKIAKVGQHPVILVGHSYGGLVIKQLCYEAHNSQSLKGEEAEFLKCVKGIFFYGTPHRGSAILSSPNGIDLKDASPLLEYVKVLCAEAARLHGWFDSLRKTHMWSIDGIGESKPTTFFTPEGKSLCEIIVEEGSARYNNFTMEDEDHFSLSQPESKTSITYRRLTNFIESIDINKVKTTKLQVPKMAMILHSHLFVEVQDILRQVPAVALCGMGGIGKTTLAKVLFNELCSQFEYTCFFQLSKGESNEDDMENLESSVYSTMQYRGEKVAGRREMWDLSFKKLLLVLDDIDSDLHTKLLRRISWKNNCANSRYIVTSRSSEYLNRCNVTFKDGDVDATVFNMSYLNFKSSKELFLSHAFLDPTNLAGINWADMIVEKCDGLPLTLEVMGSYLKKQTSESIWSECYYALDEAESMSDWNERLWAKLKVSYNCLEPHEKEIFLDAATFFHNSNWTLGEAKFCWRVAYGYEGMRWKKLVDLSLVRDVHDDKGIKMHAQMRSLGIKIAATWGDNRTCRTWAKGSILSTVPDTALEFKEIIALRLERDQRSLIWPIGEMKKLLYLDSKEVMLDVEGGELSNTVVLLRLRGKENSLHNLVDRGYDRLAILNLEAPLTCVPTAVNKLRNLESIRFEACIFEGLPETFGELCRLRILVFKSCKKLCSLPEAFGQLSKLQVLRLDDCCELRALPDSFGQLVLLERLLIFKVPNLQSLPEDFGNLSQLERLIIEDAHNISELPESFCQLPRLKALIMTSLHNLQKLPESFGNLSQLTALAIADVHNISELPESFSRLHCLRFLLMYSLHKLQRLPEGLENLSHLDLLLVLDEHNSFWEEDMLLILDEHNSSPKELLWPKLKFFIYQQDSRQESRTPMLHNLRRLHYKMFNKTKECGLKREFFLLHSLLLGSGFVKFRCLCHTRCDRRLVYAFTEYQVIHITPEQAHNLPESSTERQTCVCRTRLEMEKSMRRNIVIMDDYRSQIQVDKNFQLQDQFVFDIPVWKLRRS